MKRYVLMTSLALMAGAGVGYCNLWVANSYFIHNIRSLAIAASTGEYYSRSA